jgi:flagellar protein FlgJ
MQIGEGRYVSALYVGWSAGIPWIPWCGQEPPVAAHDGTAGFIASSIPAAQEGQRQYRVPSSVTIAQAILESGWGRSTLTRDDHNYFGMKCFGSPGPVAIGCRDYATHECSGADCWATHDDFRTYRSTSDSYVDHGRQLSSMSRYAEAMNHTDDPDRFAREVHAAGYATSSTYADKLIDLMRQYNLYQYDLPRA